MECARNYSFHLLLLQFTVCVCHVCTLWWVVKSLCTLSHLLLDSCGVKMENEPCFTVLGRCYCCVCSIDATIESGRMGRLSNHSRYETAFVCLVSNGDTPNLCLFASRDMLYGEQILYDYGVKLPFVDMVHITFWRLSFIYLSICYDGEVKKWCRIKV